MKPIKKTIFSQPTVLVIVKNHRLNSILCFCKIFFFLISTYLEYIRSKLFKKIFRIDSLNKNDFRSWFKLKLFIQNFLPSFRSVLKVLCCWNSYPVRLHEPSLQLDILITILMNNVHVNQWSLEKIFPQKSHPITSAGFPSPTQRPSFILNPIVNNPEASEIISATELTGISISTSSTVISSISIPLQVLRKTIRINSEIHIDPNKTEKFTSQDSSFGSVLPFSQFKRTKRIITMWNPFTEYRNQIEKNQTVKNQLNRSNDHALMPNTINATIPTLSRHPVALLNLVGTYSLSSTNKNPI